MNANPLKETQMQDNEKLTLSAKQTATMLGLSLGSVYNGLLTGEIPCISIGRRKIIPRAALLRMLERAGNGQSEKER